MVGNGANFVNRESVAYFLFRIFPIVRRMIPEAPPSFTLVGADWDLLDARLMETHGLEMVGFLDQAEMEERLQAARVFVSPMVID